jgi:hypothetical protein
MSELLSHPEAQPPLAPPIVLEAQEAFRRDLPELLKERHGQWVAYHGARRVGFGASKAALWRECLQQGLEDFLVCRVWPMPEWDLISAL